MSNVHALLLDCEKLRCFLNQNQLVQANAINQRLENSLHDSIIEDSKTAKGTPSESSTEANKFWKAWRSSNLVKSYILGGKQAEALENANELFSYIAAIEKKGDQS